MIMNSLAVAANMLFRLNIVNEVVLDQCWSWIKTKTLQMFYVKRKGPISTEGTLIIIKQAY